MHGEISAQQLLQLFSGAGDGPASEFAAAAESEVEAMPPAATLEVIWASVQPSLKAIYSVRRDHLADRGAGP